MDLAGFARQLEDAWLVFVWAGSRLGGQAEAVEYLFTPGGRENTKLLIYNQTLPKESIHAMPDADLLALLRHGPLDAPSLCQRLHISQPTLSRRIAEAGDAIVRIGRRAPPGIWPVAPCVPSTALLLYPSRRQRAGCAVG